MSGVIKRVNAPWPTGVGGTRVQLLGFSALELTHTHTHITNLWYVKNKLYTHPMHLWYDAVKGNSTLWSNADTQAWTYENEQLIASHIYVCIYTSDTRSGTCKKEQSYLNPTHVAIKHSPFFPPCDHSPMGVSISKKKTYRKILLKARVCYLEVYNMQIWLASAALNISTLNLAILGLCKTLRFMTTNRRSHPVYSGSPSFTRFLWWPLIRQSLNGNWH